jgi:hypothetical protein
MMRRGYIDTNPNVATGDQNRAQALDWLRTAENYVVILPTPAKYADQGPIAVLAAADGEFLLKGLYALAEALNLTVDALDLEE